MKEEERIKKDIVMFEENKKKIQQERLTTEQKLVVDLAERYYQDAQYYIKKNDYFTAFGCINYAHGLLDAIIKITGSMLE
ncbi:MAG: DUF357 domain-containing protein [Candidatus Thermoplasmatota archaeon]